MMAQADNTSVPIVQDDTGKHTAPTLDTSIGVTGGVARVVGFVLVSQSLYMHFCNAVGWIGERWVEWEVTTHLYALWLQLLVYHSQVDQYTSGWLRYYAVGVLIGCFVAVWTTWVWQRRQDRIRAEVVAQRLRLSSLGKFVKTAQYLKVVGIAEKHRAAWAVRAKKHLDFPCTVPLQAMLEVNCVRCRAAVAHMLPVDKVMQFVLGMEKHTSPKAVGHDCVFVNGEDSEYVVLLLAQALEILDERTTVQKLQLEGKKSKQGKKRGVLLSSMYDFLDKPVDDVEENVRMACEYLERLRDEQAEAEAVEADDPRAHYETMRARAAVDRWQSEIRAYYAEQLAQGGQRGREAAHLFEEREGRLEGPPNTVYYADDERMVRMQKSAALMAEAAEMEKRVTQLAEHHKEVASRVTTDKVEKIRLESPMVSSVPGLVAPSTALVVMGGDARHALIHSSNGKLVFVTQRHGPTDQAGKSRDTPWPVNSLVNFYRFGVSQPIKLQIIARTAVPHKDEIWYRTDVDVKDLPWYRPPKMTNARGTPKVGEAVTIYYAELHAGEAVWRTVQGEVLGVCSNIVAYNITTLPGHCRAPVYTKRQMICGGHLYGDYALGTIRSNACDVYSNLPQGTWEGELPAYEVVIPNLQGQVLGVGELPSLYRPELKRMTEPYKIHSLRTDKDLRGWRAIYHWMKPSTEMNKRELQRFGDKLSYKMDADVFKLAVQAAVGFDETATTPFKEPTFSRLREMVEKLDSEKTTAGYTASFQTHRQYAMQLGEGDLSLGYDRIAERALELYLVMSKQSVLSQQQQEALLFECRHWSVMGKKDGYKKKKLDVGRTIQAPCLEMKILWKVCFGEADDMWIHRNDSWVHAGENYDKPVLGARKRKILRALKYGGLALDATAFDRYMTVMFITTFFGIHMKLLAPGAPQAFLDEMCDFVLTGPLVMSDGWLFFKDRGNPSGFMNTLRLNCWANLVVTCYLMARRLMQLGRHDVTPADIIDILQNHVDPEICGDDSRYLALSEFGKELLDLENAGKALIALYNEELPWAVKLEGHACFPAGEFDPIDRVLELPSMVSRKLFFYNGELWDTLLDASRTVKRLVHAEQREPAEERELVESAFNSLALPLYMHRQGDLVSPTLAFLWREFGDQQMVEFVNRRVGRNMRHLDMSEDHY